MALVVADGAAALLPAECSKAIERLKGGELPERILMQPAVRTKWQKQVWKLASERKPNGVIGDDIESMAVDSRKRGFEPAEVAGLQAKLSRKLKKEIVPALVVAPADAVGGRFWR